MTIITVVDEKNGLLFNHRRQSQDAALRREILKLTVGHPLWMNAYSYKQFENQDELAKFSDVSIQVDEEFLRKASEDAYCFVENLALLPYLASIQEVILFKWNRTYPSDFSFDLTIPGSGWRLKESCDFAGTSHETITKEVYQHEM